MAKVLPTFCNPSTQAAKLSQGSSSRVSRSVPSRVCPTEETGSKGASRRTKTEQNLVRDLISCHPYAKEHLTVQLMTFRPLRNLRILPRRTSLGRCMKSAWTAWTRPKKICDNSEKGSEPMKKRQRSPCSSSETKTCRKRQMFSRWPQTRLGPCLGARN